MIHHIGYVTLIPNNILYLFKTLDHQLQMIDTIVIDKWDCRCNLYRLKSSETLIETIRPYSGPLFKWADKGTHHIALTVSSIEKKCNFLKEKGIRLVSDEPVTGVAGLRVNFIHPSFCGVLLEIVEVPKDTKK